MAGPVLLADGTTVDLGRERLVRPGGAEVRLRPQAFAVLRQLLASPNRLVTKAELMRAVWGATAVTDDSLVQAVGEIRRALGDGSHQLTTETGRGYRLDLPASAAAPPTLAMGAFAALHPDPTVGMQARALALAVAAAASRSPDLAVALQPDGARYRLDGTLQGPGPRQRVTVGLVEVETATSLWADTFEAQDADPFRRQDSLTEGIVGALLPALRRAETARAGARPEAGLDARELVLRALPLAAGNSAAGGAAALVLLERALALEPRRHAAHAVAAWCLEQRYLRGGFSPADRAAALRHADVALAMDCADADALAMAAFVRANLTRDYDAALASIDRALALNPLSVTALGFAALVCVHGGHHAPGVAHAERSLLLCPTDPLAYHPYCALALSNMVRGEHEAAVRYATLATRANTGFSVTHAYLAAAQANRGDAEAAALAAARLLEIDPGFTVAGFIRMDLVLFRNEVTEALAAALRRAGLPG